MSRQARGARPASSARGVGAVREILAPFLARWSAPPWVRVPVVVGCSGGTDSLALLALARAAGLDPVAVHVDHGLRAGSGEEARRVATAAERLGARWTACSVRVTPGPGLEERARDARHAVLDDERERLGATATLVGHTRDDQAETVLLNTLRGAATTGLAGIPPVRGRIVRPVLDLGRSDTAEVCARLGLDPLDDPMNADRRFRRAWIRREVLPALEAGTGRDLREILAQQAGILREESELLDELADEVLVAAADRSGRLRAREVLAAPAALARRAVRRWLVGTPPAGPPPPRRDVEEVLLVARGTRSAAELGGSRRVERSGGWLTLLDRSGPETSRPAGGWGVEGPVPGTLRGGEVDVETWVERSAPAVWPDGRWTCVLDADRVGPAAGLRTAEPDERFRPLGMTGSKPLGRLLAEAGVPARERREAVVLAAPTGTPLWVLGYRVGAPARVTARTRRYLWASAAPSGRGVPGEGPPGPGDR